MKRAEHLKIIKELHKAKYPKAKADERKKLGLKNLKQYAGSEIISSPENLHLSFAKSTTTKLCVSPRTVQ